MAQDLERLVVSLSADIKKYDNALRKAQGLTNRRAKQIESRFSRMNKGLNRQFVGLGRNIALAFAGGASLRGAQQLIDASIRIENALKVAGLAGTELTTVYDQLFASAQRNAAPLEALTELYSRVSLVQGELGITTEELVSFTDRVALSLRLSGQSAQESVGALLQLSQALGNGIVQAEEYSSLIDGAPLILRAVAAGLEEAGGSVAKLTRLVKTQQVSSQALFRAFEAGAVILEDKVAGAELTVSQSFIRLQNVLIDTAGRANKGTDASRRLAEALDGLTDTLAQTNFEPFIDGITRFVEASGQGIEVAGRLKEAYQGVIDTLRAFSEWTGGAAIGDALGLTRIDSEGRELQRIQDRINNAFAPFTAPKSDRLTSDTATSTTPVRVTPVSLADYPFGGVSGGGGARAASEYREAEKAAKAFEKAQKEAEQTANELGDTLGNALGSLASAFEDGKIEASELLSIVTQIATQLLSVNSVGGGFGGGFLSGILGSIFHDGGVVGGSAPRRSVHPAAFAGARRYHSGGIAGLRPGEVPAILEKGEIVLPKGTKGAQQATAFNMPITINAPGADAAQLMRVQEEVKRLRKDVPKLVDARTDTRQTRGTRP